MFKFRRKCILGIGHNRCEIRTRQNRLETIQLGFLTVFFLTACKPIIPNKIKINFGNTDNISVPMTLYFYNDGTQVNANWTTLANWWTSSSHDVQASRLPSNSDSIYLMGPFSPTSGPSSTLILSLFDSSALVPADNNGLNSTVTTNIEIKAGGTLIIGEAGELAYTNQQNWNGSVASSNVTSLFQGTALNIGSAGTATFNDLAQNIGNVLGNAIFNGTWNSYGDQTVGPYGQVQGNAIFNGGGNGAGSSGGNNGNVVGNATYNADAVNGTDSLGNVGGIATFNNSSENQGWNGTIGTAIFNNNSKNKALITGNATFYNSSRNLNEVDGFAIFYNTSCNSNTGTTPNHAPVFNDGSGVCP